MQAKQTKNSSMILNLSFCPLAAAATAALFNATPLVVTCDVIRPEVEAAALHPALSFFRFPVRCSFLLCRLPDLENLEMLMP
jgi:hypothetical protein